MFSKPKMTQTGKQYTIRSEVFTENKDPDVQDAVLDENDPLFEIAKLAGIGNQAAMNAYSPTNEMRLTNPSAVANEKIQQQQANNIQPGTAEWFRLWFGTTY